MRTALGNQSKNNINHEGCSAGRDTRERLYVERKDYGVVAHCFNCGESGFIPSDMGKGNTYRTRFEHFSRYRSNDSIVVPTDFTKAYAAWSGPARAWVGQYGITTKGLTDFQVGYSSFLGGVVFPLCNLFSAPLTINGNMYGFVLRYTDNNTNSKGPKYSFKIDSELARGTDVWINMNQLDSNVLVLCEDILSGIKLSSITNSIALLKTTITLKTVAYIYSLYKLGYVKNIIIHLDNDNATVRKHSVDIFNKLNMVIHENDLRIIYGWHDPKYYRAEELHKIYS